MSSSTAGKAPSKSASTFQSASLSPTQPQSSSSIDSGGQRRSGSSGSVGAGFAARKTVSSARNNQSSRKQHRGSRRPRFAGEDAIAESAAMKSTSSRKGQTSITHLMNFTLPPRPQYQHRLNNHNARRNPTWGLGSGYHAIDKARQASRVVMKRYIHANYRFVVDPREEYRSQAVDADIPLDWTSVLQILASTQTQGSACPICLSPPVAPRMAKCGHIFCLPCLIRYMHSADELRPIPEKKARWKKCPICWDSVYVSETRSVRWYTGQEGDMPREGEDVVLRLMMRRPGNTLALPRDSADFLTNTEEVPWHVAAEVMDYARVMKGGEDYVNAQLDQEIEHLQQQEHEDEVMYGDDPEWTKKAVNAIREAKQRTQGIGNPPDMPRQPLEARVTRRPIQFHANNDNVPDMYLVQHAARSGQSSSDGPSTPQSHTPHSTVSHPENLSVGFLPDQDLADHPADHGSGISSSLPSTTSTAAAPMVRTQPPNAVPSHHISELPYYFYQASLHYYLSPLDIRILKSAFGDFSSFPTTVLARVERVSTGHTVDEELRKRAKYLSHLPYGCEVGFLECDWTDIVSHEVLSRFDSEITKRRKRNQEKEAREEKERVRAEKDEEEKRYISARRKRPAARRESDLHNDLYRPTSPLRDNVSSSIDISNASVSPPWSSNSRHHTGSAFAPLASPSSSPETARTVWGTAAIAPSSPQIAVQAPEVESSENDGWLQGWEKDLMQEDDLVAQVQAATLAEGSAQGANQGNVTKKKKGKKITLMSTNVRRGA